MGRILLERHGGQGRLVAMTRNMSVSVEDDDGKALATYKLIQGAHLKVDEGDTIKRGQRLFLGISDPTNLQAIDESLRRAMAELAGFGTLGREGGLSAERPVLVDRFLEDATEVDVGSANGGGSVAVSTVLGDTPNFCPYSASANASWSMSPTPPARPAAPLAPWEKHSDPPRLRRPSAARRSHPCQGAGTRVPR